MVAAVSRAFAAVHEVGEHGDLDPTEPRDAVVVPHSPPHSWIASSCKMSALKALLRRLSRCRCAEDDGCPRSVLLSTFDGIDRLLFSRPRSAAAVCVRGPSESRLICLSRFARFQHFQVN